MSTLIELKNIIKIYNAEENPTVALDDLSLKIDKGEYVSIIGASGSGKSTLLNLLGLLDTTTSGQYYFEGVDITNYDDNAQTKTRLDKFGFIFQSFNLMNRSNCERNVELPMLYQGLGKKQRIERARELLKLMGIEDKAKRYPNQLSGGQRQRVAIARALTNHPEVILADEPTGALDSKTAKSILELLKELHDQGNTIIVVTHDLEVAHAANRIVTIKDGKILNDEVLK